MKKLMLTGFILGMAMTSINALAAARGAREVEKDLSKLRTERTEANRPAIMNEINAETRISNLSNVLVDVATKAGKSVSSDTLKNLAARKLKVKSAESPDGLEVTGESILRELARDADEIAREEAKGNMTAEGAEVIQIRKKLIADTVEFVALLEHMSSDAVLIPEVQKHVDAVVKQVALSSQLSGMTKAEAVSHLEVMASTVALASKAPNAAAAKADLLFFKALEIKAGTRDAALKLEEQLIDCK